MDWNLVFLWLHFLALFVAVVLLAVPSWRRWLLSTPWSIVLFIVAAHGAFYVGLYWPESLGGTSVGWLLIYALLGGLAICLLAVFVWAWWNDRVSAIEMLALPVIAGGSAYAIEIWLGHEFLWLLLIPLIAYFVIREHFAES